MIVQVQNSKVRKDLEAFLWQQENVNKFKSLGGIAEVFVELRHFAEYPSPSPPDVLEYRSNLVLVLTQLIRWSPSVSVIGRSSQVSDRFSWVGNGITL